MDSTTAPVKMSFFPFVGGGHQIPMIDTARVFASHGAKSTILTTPSNAINFNKSIARDQQSGLNITIHILTLPPNVPEITDMSAGPMTDTSALLQPFKDFLIHDKPDCVVIDIFHRWAGEVVDELQIRRLMFTGNACFPRCVQENIRRHVQLENLSSDYEPFVVPHLPDRIEMTKSQLPTFHRNPSLFANRLKTVKNLEETSFGTIINSFYELEPAYADYLRKEFAKKAWLVGPVSLCNRSREDKTERGKLSTIDEQSCLNWLSSKKPNSVLYISFGSLARVPNQQLKEIAYALEASDQSFIWVVRATSISSSKNEDDGGADFLPDGFEERMKENQKGLIIRGWAPQLLILEHEAVGGYMTHCGWNSTLEGVSTGVPMITWPLSAEQFSNEKLVTDVLKIGVQVGSKEWMNFHEEWKEILGREKVELAVKKLMGKSEEGEEMRRRAKELAGKARKAVEEGGTSYAEAEALIEELKALRVST